MYFEFKKYILHAQWTLFTKTPFVPKHFDVKLILLL